LAVWDAMREHLSNAGRQDDPHQASRLAYAVSDLEMAFGMVRDAYTRVAVAIGWEAVDVDAKIALVVDAARVGLEETAERLLPLAVRSVGCSGLMETHPLHIAIRDLTVYMRQPGPDAVRVRLGRAAADGTFRAAFDD
jgi:alkylation response protein AidB-like acyl-CoA dehydrogenase